MVDQVQRLTEIVRDEIKKVALRDDVGFAISQGFAPVPQPGGGMGLGPCWLVTVTLRNPLLGNPDIAQCAPIPGVMPPEQAFRVTVSALLDGCRSDRDALMRGGDGASEAPALAVGR